MSAEKGPKTTERNEAEPDVDSRLPDLMQPRDAGEKERGATDLERQALRAAEEALAAGQRALAEVRAQVEPDLAARRPRREAALRALLMFNLLLMVGVMLWPDPRPAPSPPAATGPVAPPLPQPAPPDKPPPTVLGDLYDQGLRAAAVADYAKAIELLERYLQQSPRLHVAQQGNVYHALAHYSFQLGDLARSQDYDRKAAALLRSHTLPEDLLQMAQKAEERGDTEALRRLWARFLLQQRQVPAALYKHVAEAYLKLGDSYRMEAAKAADEERRAELEQLRQSLRQGSGKDPGKEGK